MQEYDVMGIIGKVLNFTLFTLNQTPITVTSLIIFVIIFTAFLIAAKVIARIFAHKVLARFHFDEGIKYNFERVTRYTIAIAGAIVAFQFVGINLSGLAVIFGLLSVGVGFGLQNVTSNFVAGLILLFERPIKVGDRVSVGETEGDVKAINMRSTTIRSIDNISIIVPNSEFISSTVTNWSYGDKKVRINIGVGVSYSSDLETVLRCLDEVAGENGQVLKNPEPQVHFMEFGDSSWNMTLRCWIADPKQHRNIKSAINCAIVRKFREHNVEIPFPQRDLHVRSSIALPLSPSGDDVR